MSFATLSTFSFLWIIFIYDGIPKNFNFYTFLYVELFFIHTKILYIVLFNNLLNNLFLNLATSRAENEFLEFIKTVYFILFSIQSFQYCIIIIPQSFLYCIFDPSCRECNNCK